MDWSGIALVASYVHGKWYPAVAYDKVNSDDIMTLDKQYKLFNLCMMELVPTVAFKILTL